MGKPFNALFWNVWVDSQIADDKLQVMQGRLDHIITHYDPDVLGLNEVMADENGNSKLLKHLEEQGYTTFFAPFSPERNGQFSGSALASRVKPQSIAAHELGPDNDAAIRGYPGHTVKLIQAKLPHGDSHVNVVVNHLAHLVPWNIPVHLMHHREFLKLVGTPELQRTTIIGGDFNQFKFMPYMWGADSLYHRATGTFLNPTWRLLGGKLPILQANYDNIFWTKCGTLQLEEFEVLDRHPSDHTPLVARFTVE